MPVQKQSVPRALRNALLERIKAEGRDVTEFVHTPVDATSHWLVTHIPTGSWFAIVPAPASGQVHFEYFPDQIGGRVGSPTHNVVEARHELARDVADWVKGIQGEQDTADLWASVAISRDALTGADVFGDDTPMTPSESKAAEAAGRELGELLLAASLRTEEQVESIKASVEYLVQASKRSSKKQWTMLLSGTIMKLAVEGVIKSDQVQGVVSFVAGLLRGAWGAATKLLE